MCADNGCVPSPPDPLDVTVPDVLRLLHIADQSLRAQDITYVQDRLAVTDALGRFDEPDMAAYYDNTLSRPAACVAAFVARCQQRGLWDWCKQVMSFAELNAISVANAAAAQVSEKYAGWCDDVPVPTLCLYPDAYRLIALTDLPYGHSLGGCGHSPDRGTNEYRNTEARLKRPIRRLMRGHRPVCKVPPQEVWVDIQRRVEGRELAPCALHAMPLDWSLINDAAQQVVQQTPFYTSGGVNKWDPKTANAHTYEAAHSYTWPGPQVDNLNQMRVRLRALFNDPIIWQPGRDQVSSGQHRICMQRHAGATHSFIVDAERHDTLHSQWQAAQPAV